MTFASHCKAAWLHLRNNRLTVLANTLRVANASPMYALRYE